jgi:hypothetical protein
LTEFHGIPWNFVNLSFIKFHGIPWKISWNSMGKYHEKIRQMFMKYSMENPWNSMEFSMEIFMEWNSMENSMN